MGGGGGYPPGPPYPPQAGMPGVPMAFAPPVVGAPALTPEQFQELYGAQLRQHQAQIAHALGMSTVAQAVNPSYAIQNARLRKFWREQMEEIQATSDFKTHLLPLARIKKIMKSDEDVRMISSEAPVLFAKACEMFILELTTRAWVHAQESKRRTLLRSDIAAAITKTDIFDFLVDIVPRDDFKEDGMNVPRAPPAAVALGAPGGGDGQGGAGQAGAVPAVPYNPGMYYMQPPPGTMAGGQWPPQMSQDPYQNQMPPKQ